jgi:hypothetical protein
MEKDEKEKKGKNTINRFLFKDRRTQLEPEI